MRAMAHRAFKDQIYAQFARVGSALASEKRLELLDLLAQAPRHVEALAEETEMSVANTSQHLQALRAARLVESSRDGTRVVYRLANKDVLTLWLALRSVAEAHLADVAQISRQFDLGGDADERIDRDSLHEMVAVGEALIVDVRPVVEFEYGHLPDAVSAPLGELPEAAAELPRDRKLVVYCRGTYCQFADDAVAILRRAGFDAVRLEGGWPEWLMDGRPTSRDIAEPRSSFGHGEDGRLGGESRKKARPQRDSRVLSSARRGTKRGGP
jgi:rhodanese-related sulfurtransferase/DNA-binding MarR family transcriptional regulator